MASKRKPVLRASYSLPGELVVDLFAGGGGASTGLEAAFGRPVDIAINHDPRAIAMHAANHPDTKHYVEDVFEVDPMEACAAHPVGVLWLSPDCTHHSKAKGGRPRNSKIRALAWVAVRWAELPKHLRPRVILLENVEEFADWGPLDSEGQPIPERAGETFNEWRGRLSDLEYQIDYRLLTAADYGAPTTRKRLFLVARCDQAPIVWPEPTHGKGRARPWRPAAEIIDWSLPCPSIFLSKEEAKIYGVRRPLKEATLRRIFRGLQKYVFGTANPFIIPLTHHGDSRTHDIEEPLRTITAAHRGEFALVGPTLIQTSWGERPGQAPRVPGLEKPLGTICAQGRKHALVAPVVLKHYGGLVGHQTPGSHIDSPLGTITATDHHALAAAYLTKMYGTSTGAELHQPLPTITANGHGGGHLAEVRAFLIKYYSASGAPQGQSLAEPVHTVTTKARFGLITVHGVQYQIVDIGMRMLAVPELFRAQGFPDDYDIRPLFNGKPLTQTDQIHMVGNSVNPPLAEKLADANTRLAA